MALELFFAAQGPAPLWCLWASTPQADDNKAAAAWGVAPAEFSFTVPGVIMDPFAPLVHYVTGGAVLEAVAPATITSHEGSIFVG